MNAEYQLGIHLQMTVELLADTTHYVRLLLIHLDAVSPPLFIFFYFQQRMSVRMDSFSATTKGVYQPSGGATMTTTVQTTAMKKTVVSVQIRETKKDECLLHA